MILRDIHSLPISLSTLYIVKKVLIKILDDNMIRSSSSFSGHQPLALKYLNIPTKSNFPFINLTSYSFLPSLPLKAHNHLPIPSQKLALALGHVLITFIQEKKNKKKRRLLLQFFRGDRQLGFQFFRLLIGVNRLINIPRKIQIVKKSQLRLLISKVYVYG